LELKKKLEILLNKAQLKQRKKNHLSPVRTISLESMSEQIGEGKIKELNLVVKDRCTRLFMKLLEQSLIKISNVEEVKLRMIHSAVGDVTENDVTLAARIHLQL
jgi:translation initiation factor IF-2